MIPLQFILPKMPISVILIMNKIKRTNQRLLYQHSQYQKTYRPQAKYSAIEKNRRKQSYSFLETLKFANSMLFNSKSSKVKISLQEDFITSAIDDFDDIPAIENPVYTIQQTVIINKLKSQDLNYQTLLITEKEKDLEMLEEENKLRQYKNRFRNLSAPIAEAHQRVHNLEKVLAKKEAEIKLYYEYLASQMHVDSQKILQTKQQNMRKLEQELQQQQALLSNQLANLEQIRQEKIDQIKEHENEKNQLIKNINKAKELKKKSQQQYVKNKAIQQQREIQFKKRLELSNELDKQIQLLANQQQKLTEELIRLKQIQSVEEEHEKACLVIERAIVLKQTRKVVDEMKKREMAKEYEQKLIPQFRQLQKVKLKQNQQLLKKIDQKNRELENLIRENSANLNVKN